ncbi:MAG TPA: FtsX-like permease family protein [Candidatus Paceibacterota bacterium]|nr:FtsX-like permease family protein [Candidatus Paceibacterota bacterium]
MNTLRVGFLLAWKQIRHASIWTTSLIIFIMMLTFLNLVAVSGILVGLIEGSVKTYSDQFTGDVFITTPTGEKYIEKSTDLLSTIETLPGIASYSARFTEGASIEANYRDRRDPNALRDTVGATLVGLDPETEDVVTGLSGSLVEGEYLTEDDGGYVMLGANLLEQYSPLGQGDDVGYPTLSNVAPGTRVRVTVGDATKEYIVKGILKTKVDEISRRIFVTRGEFVRLAGRTNLNVNEIAIRATVPAAAPAVKEALLGSGAGERSLVRLSREGLPKFLIDIMNTFAMLGNGISSIGLLVSSITIFIVIFVNAITRRKYIGILKGIGIRASAIELSYVFQSLLYAVIGSGLALVIIYGFLVPFFYAHPIDFPFSDGILVAPISGTLIKLVILVVATLIAGYIPAWMIIKRNTLDSILGR